MLLLITKIGDTLTGLENGRYGISMMASSKSPMRFRFLKSISSSLSSSIVSGIDGSEKRVDVECLRDLLHGPHRDEHVRSSGHSAFFRDSQLDNSIQELPLPVPSIDHHG